MIQQLDRESANIYADEFGLFYGTFEAGRKSGYGVEIDDVGVFAGRLIFEYVIINTLGVYVYALVFE